MADAARRVLLACAFLLSLSGLCRAAEVDTDGAVVGRWTMDVDAARALAKREKLPVLLNFTGSDWCGWCKLMEENVFSKQAWKDYAKDNVVMVFIDFPKKTGLVPKKYVARNEELKETYGVRGYPTYVVLDDDAETVLGQLGAGREKTPEGFIGELRAATRYSSREVARYAEGLSAAKRAEYTGLVGKMDEVSRSVKAEKQRIEEAQKRIKELEEEAEGLREAATEFRAAQLGPAKLEEYREARSGLKVAEKELADWLATNPQRNQKNAEKFQAMNSEIERLKQKVAEF